MISRGATVGEESSAKRKVYIRSVHSVKTKPNRPYSSLLITLSNEDFKGIQTHHNDLVAVLVVIANFETWKILVDSGSAVDILFYKTFQRMKLPLD